MLLYVVNIFTSLYDITQLLLKIKNKNKKMKIKIKKLNKKLLTL